MRQSEKLGDELGRLAALQRYAVLDTPPEEPFDKLTKLVQKVLGVPIAAVSLLDAKRLWFKSIAGLSVCEAPREISFCAYAIHSAEPLVIPDMEKDPRFVANPLVTGEPWVRSYLGIPLITPDGYNLGALCAIDTKARAFDDSQIAVMQSFASLVMNELELRQIAMSDGLTGAMSRRGWVQAAERELARAQRYGTEAAVIVLDVDHFKMVNDVHGHPAGDAVLRSLTQVCLEEMRDSDVLGRLGGEEFAILLPETGTAGAAEVAERLRDRIAATPVAVDGTSLRITASFGIASLRPGITSVEGWLAAADALLYEAKASGRNCCRSAVVSQ